MAKKSVASNKTKQPKKADDYGISQSHINRWFELDGKIKALRREADALAKQLDPFKDQFQDCVREHGGESGCIVLHGCRIAIEQANGSPAWKAIYVQLAGIKAADKIIAETPARSVLKVERIA